MYDYVIVGAGSAGCVLANRLSADPACRVALVEAGGSDRKMEIRIPAAFSKLFKTAYDWDFSTTPQAGMAGRSMYWPRGRTLGGSSSINAQMWVRGFKADYDGWGPGWTYADVLPSFHRIERRVGSNHDQVYGTNGPLWIEEVPDPSPVTTAFFAACAEVGLRRLTELNAPGLPAPDYAGYAPTPVTQHRGRRWSAADAYLHPVRRRPNLHLVTGGHATRLLLDGDRATGVQYIDATGAPQRLDARREVLLAAGAIGSPQLLMLSGIGDPAHLAGHGIEVQHALPGVGRNLQDHLAAGWIVHCPVPVTLVAAESAWQLVKYLLFRRGMLASNVAEAVAFFPSTPGLAEPDLEIIFAPVPFLDHGQTMPPGHGITVGVILLQPESHGRITLASADPAAAPVIDPAYFTAEADIQRLVAGMRFARRIVDSEALRPYVGAPMRPDRQVTSDEELVQFLRQWSETLYHPVGTCRMGTDELAVVDAELRVHGVRGLRVVDASVMPRIIRGHTHAPTLMIAERAAGFVRAAAGVAPRVADSPTS